MLPLLNYFHLVLLLLDFFVPIMGRRGSDVNPDFILGVLVVVVTHLVCAFMLPQVPRTGEGHKVARWISYVWLVAYVLVAFTQVRSRARN